MIARPWRPPTRFQTIAPRLAEAHRQRNLEIIAEREARTQARERVLRLERLVAHRELQEVRAMTRNSNRYLKRRQDKTAMAIKELAEAVEHLARLEAAA